MCQDMIKKVKIKKTKKIKLPKKKSDVQLKKELDTIYSKWIRLKDIIKGNAVCVTCGSVRPWQEMQCGHYISRTYLATRFLEENTHVQCLPCNVFKHGNYTNYAQFMIRKYGIEHLDFLDREKNKITKYFPYQEKIDYYKEKVAQLLKML